MKRIPADLTPDVTCHMPGVVYTRMTRWGERVQAWPRKGWMGKSRQAEWQRQVFRIAAAMTSSPLDLDWIYAVNVTKGTSWTPRDFLTRCCYGTAFEIVGPGDIRWTNVKRTAPEPPPPPPPEEDHMWEWSLWDAAWSTTFSGAGAATKGAIITPRTNAAVKAIRIIANYNLNATYRAAIYTIDGAMNITGIVASADVPLEAPGHALIEYDIATDLSAGVSYAIALTLLGQGGTTPLRISLSQTPRWLWPVTPGNAVSLSSDDPSVGQTFTIGAFAVPPIALKI